MGPADPFEFASGRPSFSFSPAIVDGRREKGRRSDANPDTRQLGPIVDLRQRVVHAIDGAHVELSVHPAAA